MNLATQNSANAPKNSLENYKKLDYNSLSDDEKSEGYIFHILTDKITENSRKKLENLAQTLAEIYPCEIEIHICDDSIFHDFPKWGGNYLAYYRLFIPNFMPQSAKICLYLDTDMLAMQDLRALFTLDLDGKIAGVVKDVRGAASKILQAKSPENKDFQFDGNFYFNAGFLLMNLREWRGRDIKGRSLECLRTYDLKFPDQDALNFIIREPLALTLPFEFNLASPAYTKSARADFLCSLDEIEFAVANPAIVHFWGGKPWVGILGHCELWRIKWWLVALQTPFFSDELFGTLASILQTDCGVNKDEFARLKNLEHFGGFVKFYTHKQFIVKPKNFLAKIRRKTRFIRYPIKRFFGFGGERV